LRCVAEEFPVERARGLHDRLIAVREQHIDTQAFQSGRFEVSIEIDNP
jgi:hypothetical protein